MKRISITSKKIKGEIDLAPLAAYLNEVNGDARKHTLDAKAVEVVAVAVEQHLKDCGVLEKNMPPKFDTSEAIFRLSLWADAAVSVT